MVGQVSRGAQGAAASRFLQPAGVVGLVLDPVPVWQLARCQQESAGDHRAGFVGSDTVAPSSASRVGRTSRCSYRPAGRPAGQPPSLHTALV
jgi:hypothetical protein